jgi:hypothetical protein
MSSLTFTTKHLNRHFGIWILQRKKIRFLAFSKREPPDATEPLTDLFRRLLLVGRAMSRTPLNRLDSSVREDEPTPSAKPLGAGMEIVFLDVRILVIKIREIRKLLPSNSSRSP